MSGLALRPIEDCLFDLVALGEVMLRFDPGDGRIATTRSFAVSEGGGEYNVARGLRRCFGLRTALVTAIPDNPVGRLLEDLILQGGVDQRHVRWAPYDGIGREGRVGLNFVERGFGVRAALGCSDRAHSAAAAMKPGDVDWDRVFGDAAARSFHCGGIFAALSPGAAALALEAMTAARRHGTVVSFDLNYRPSLWKASGGTDAAAATNRALVEQVDVLLGNEEDFSAALGYSLEAVDESLTDLDVGAYERLHREVLAGYPNLAVVATSLRGAHTDGQRLERGLQRERRVPRGAADARARDPRPRRRRRLVRLRAHLRPARRRRARHRARLRRRPRRARDDHPRRHVDGDARRGRARHARRRRPRRPLEAGTAAAFGESGAAQLHRPAPSRWVRRRSGSPARLPAASTCDRPAP